MSTTSGGESIELDIMEEDATTKQTHQFAAKGTNKKGRISEANDSDAGSETTKLDTTGGGNEQDAAGGTSRKGTTSEAMDLNASIGVVEQSATGFRNLSYYAIPKELTNEQQNVLEGMKPLLDPNCDIEKGLNQRASFMKTLSVLSEDKVIRNELLRRAVDTRNNKAIIEVLKSCQKSEIQKNSETISMACLRAIILLTIKNDPESLRAVLKWAQDEEISLSRKDLPTDMTCYPLQVAANEGYTLCLRLLYEHGLDIKKDPVDIECIDKLMKDDWSAGGKFKCIRFLRFFDFCSGNYVHNDITCFGLKKNLWCEEKSKLDPVERYMSLSAFSNPAYISIAYKGKYNSESEDMSKSDPLRIAFACATYAKYLAENNPQFSKQYENISDRCEVFATELLDQCECNDEVDILLQDKVPEEEILEKEDVPDSILRMSCISTKEAWAETNVWEENKNWNISLWEEHRSFVSHHYFQEFIIRKMWPPWSEEHYTYKSIFWNIPLAIILFFFYPLITIVDLIFREANILFLNPTTHSRMKKVEMSILSFFRERIHRPIYRLIIDVFFEAIFLINLKLVIWDPENNIGKPEMEWYDYTFVYLVLSYLIDGIIEIFRHPYSSFWKRYSFLTNLCFFIGYILQGAGFFGKSSNNKALMSGNDPAMIGTALICFAGTASIYRMVRWLLIFKSTGPVVISLTKVIQDVIVVIYLLIIIFTAFWLGFYGMFNIYQDQNRSEMNATDYILDPKHQDLANIWTAMPRMIWSILEPDPIAMIKRNQNKTVIIPGNLTSSSMEQVDSWEFYHLMAVFMCLMYQIFVVIILINILISLMSATYSQISVNADMYWKFSKTFKLMDYLSPRATFPPPFRPIYYLAKHVYKCKGGEVSNKTGTDKKAYYDLLFKLVTRRDHIKDEASKQVAFSYLQQDIKNLIENQEQKVIPCNSIIKEEAPKPDAFSDLKRDIKNLTENQEQMDGNQKQMTGIQKQMLGQIQNLSEKISKMEGLLERISQKMDNLQGVEDFKI